MEFQKRYWSNGTVAMEIPIVNGKRHGTARYYESDGTLYYEVDYDQDFIHGQMKRYDQEGRLEFISVFNEGINQYGFKRKKLKR